MTAPRKRNCLKDLLHDIVQLPDDILRQKAQYEKAMLLQKHVFSPVTPKGLRVAAVVEAAWNLLKFGEGKLKTISTP